MNWCILKFMEIVLLYPAIHAVIRKYNNDMKRVFDKTKKYKPFLWNSSMPSSVDPTPFTVNLFKVLKHRKRTVPTVTRIKRRNFKLIYVIICVNSLKYFYQL